MSKDFDGFKKKSIYYSMYSFSHLSKVAIERCSFKYAILNFLQFKSNNQEFLKQKILKNYPVKVFIFYKFVAQQIFIKN